MIKGLKSINLPGEASAEAEVLRHADNYGYGLLISLLRKKWAEKLVMEHGIPEASAIEATNMDPYPLDIPD